MHRDDDHIMLDGLDDTTLDVVFPTDLFQSTKQQGMMTHYEVTPLLYRFVNYLLVDVQTQQCP